MQTQTKTEIKNVGDIVNVPLKIIEVRQTKNGIVYIANVAKDSRNYCCFLGSLELKDEDIS